MGNPPVVVTDNALAKSVYYPQFRLLSSVYISVGNNQLSRELFYEDINNIIRFAQDHLIMGILADVRRLTNHVVHAVKYLDEEVIPLMKATGGYTHEAFVINDSHRQRQLAMNLINVLTRHGVGGRFFYDVEAASAWLRDNIATATMRVR